MSLFVGIGIGFLCMCVSSSSSSMSLISSSDSSGGGSGGGSGSEKMSEKPSKFMIYDNKQCTGKPVYDLIMGKGVNLSDKIVKNDGLENNACCIKTENMEVSGTFSQSNDTTYFKETHLGITGDQRVLPQFILPIGVNLPSGLTTDSCPNVWNFKVRPLK